MCFIQMWCGSRFWRETAVLYHRFITIPKGVKKGLCEALKNLPYITALSLQKLTPDIIEYTAIYQEHFIFFMKPCRCQAILFQKADPIGFFNSYPKYWNQNSNNTFLKKLESCVIRKDSMVSSCITTHFLIG